MRSCNTDHPAFAKFAAQTPLDRVTNPKAAGAPSPPRESAATMARREQEAKQGDRKNFMIVRKRATASNLQVYCDYGVDRWVCGVGGSGGLLLLLLLLVMVAATAGGGVLLERERVTWTAAFG